MTELPSCETCRFLLVPAAEEPCRLCRLLPSGEWTEWQPRDDTYIHPVVGKVHVHPTPGVASDFETHPAGTAKRLAELEAAQEGRTGWVLVPVEPTQAMCQEGQWKAREWPKFPLRIVPIWKAMLAAAPVAHDMAPQRRIAQLEQEVAACERRLADMAIEMQKFMDEAQQRR